MLVTSLTIISATCHAISCCTESSGRCTSFLITFLKRLWVLFSSRRDCGSSTSNDPFCNWNADLEVGIELDAEGRSKSRSNLPKASTRPKLKPFSELFLRQSRSGSANCLESICRSVVFLFFLWSSPARSVFCVEILRVTPLFSTWSELVRR